MIVLRKKKIVLMVCLILVSVLGFYLQEPINKETMPTVSLPVSNKVIVVDAGHGVPDEGDSLLKLNSKG